MATSLDMHIFLNHFPLLLSCTPYFLHACSTEYTFTFNVSFYERENTAFPPSSWGSKGNGWVLLLQKGKRQETGQEREVNEPTYSSFQFLSLRPQGPFKSLSMKSFDTSTFSYKERPHQWSQYNLRSGSIFISLWKLHSGGHGETKREPNFSAGR